MFQKLRPGTHELRPLLTQLHPRSDRVCTTTILLHQRALAAGRIQLKSSGGLGMSAELLG